LFSEVFSSFFIFGYSHYRAECFQKRSVFRGHRARTSQRIIQHGKDHVARLECFVYKVAAHLKPPFPERGQNGLNLVRKPGNTFQAEHAGGTFYGVHYPEYC